MLCQAFGDCACDMKNFHKKKVDLLRAGPPDSIASIAWGPVSGAADPNCTTGYDETVATPWFDCPHGATAVPGYTAPDERQQARAADEWLACSFSLFGTRLEAPHHTSSLPLPQAWYENARSISSKLQLAAGRSLAGVGFWTARVYE